MYDIREDIAGRTTHGCGSKSFELLAYVLKDQEAEIGQEVGWTIKSSRSYPY